ncbi:hypothetical protein ACFLU6_16425, partial [Acidobacteriota bacterium]
MPKRTEPKGDASNPDDHRRAGRKTTPCLPAMIFAAGMSSRMPANKLLQNVNGPCSCRQRFK